jgi:hypothetical protein
MKATEYPEVEKLVAVLSHKKLESLDDTALGRLVAAHIAKVLRSAQVRDCPDNNAARKIGAELKRALDACLQYEDLKRAAAAQATEGQNLGGLAHDAPEI